MLGATGKRAIFMAGLKRPCHTSQRFPLFTFLFIFFFFTFYLSYFFSLSLLLLLSLTIDDIVVALIAPRRIGNLEMIIEI